MSSPALTTDPIGVDQFTAELRRAMINLICNVEDIAPGDVPEDYLLAVYSGGVEAAVGIAAYRELCNILNQANLSNTHEPISNLSQDFIERTYAVDRLMKTADLIREASNQVTLLARRASYRSTAAIDLISVNITDEYSLNFEGMARMLEELPEIYKQVRTYDDNNPWYDSKYFVKSPEALQEFMSFIIWYGQLIAWYRTRECTDE
jgi:hypothetical protein